MAERRRRPKQNFIFGYEEALGYCVGETVADKDGVSAALPLRTALAGSKDGRSDLLGRLAEIYKQIGSSCPINGCSGSRALVPQGDMAQAVDRARRHAPQEVHSASLVERYDFNEGAPWEPSLSANLIALNLWNRCGRVACVDSPIRHRTKS